MACKVKRLIIFVLYTEIYLAKLFPEETINSLSGAVYVTNFLKSFESYLSKENLIKKDL